MVKKIVICDDHTLFLNGVSEILKKNNNDFEITVFSDVESCKLHFQNHLEKIDVFVCDLNINNYDGFVLLDEMKNKLQNTKTIILSAYFEDFLIQKAKRNGIHAFLKKETTIEELIQVINMEINTPFYTNKVKNTAKNNYSSIDETFVNKYRLSKQEINIIVSIIDGLTSVEISEKLNISKFTVDTHRKNINKKLEISNSSSLIKFANENKLFN
jgi:DNA-binding NarL/FixJ family response regulator